MWSIVHDLIRNQDYFGVEIRDDDDPITKQLCQMGKYIGEQFLPISVQKFRQMQRTSKTPVKNALVSLTGIQPAPKYISRTPAEKLLYHILAERVPNAPRSREALERSRFRKEFIANLRAGKDVNHVAAKAVLGQKQHQAAITESTLSPFAAAFNRLGFREAMDVFAVANEAERKEVRMLLVGKHDRAENVTEEEQRYYEELLKPPTTAEYKRWENERKREIQRRKREAATGRIDETEAMLKALESLR